MKLKIIIVTVLVLLIAFFFKAKGGFSFNPFSTAQAVGDLIVDWGVPSGQPIFVVNNFMPGQEEKRTVKITNASSNIRIVGVQGIKTSLFSFLATALEITISENGKDIYGGSKGTKTLSQFFMESSILNSVKLFTINPGETKITVFKVKFRNSSGNLFQKTKVIFDLKIGYYQTEVQGCGNIKFIGPVISPFPKKCFFTR